MSWLWDRTGFRGVDSNTIPFIGVRSKLPGGAGYVNWSGDSVGRGMCCRHVTAGGAATRAKSGYCCGPIVLGWANWEAG